jgi:hypothetical protein
MHVIICDKCYNLARLRDETLFKYHVSIFDFELQLLKLENSNACLTQYMFVSVTSFNKAVYRGL